MPAHLVNETFFFLDVLVTRGPICVDILGRGDSHQRPTVLGGETIRDPDCRGTVLGIFVVMHYEAVSGLLYDFPRIIG